MTAIPIKYLDISKVSEKYILHQCNCLSVTSNGISSLLCRHFKYGDPYHNRRLVQNRNYAVPEDRSTPGTISVFDGKDSLPSIICLYSQYRPGRTTKNYGYPKDYPDSARDRLRYLSEGLESLLEYFESVLGEFPIIAVPFMLGCGLAKGHWETYFALLQNFHYQLQQNGGGLVFYRI